MSRKTYLEHTDFTHIDLLPAEWFIYKQLCDRLFFLLNDDYNFHKQSYAMRSLTDGLQDI